MCAQCVFTDLSVSLLVEKEVENERTTKEYLSLFSVLDLISILYSFSFPQFVSLTFIHTLAHVHTQNRHSDKYAYIQYTYFGLQCKLKMNKFNEIGFGVSLCEEMGNAMRVVEDRLEMMVWREKRQTNKQNGKKILPLNEQN